MKMMSAATYTEYSRILRTLRTRGERVDFLQMGLAADLAMAVCELEPDEVEIAKLRKQLGLEGDG